MKNTIELKENERIEDLQAGGLGIIQSNGQYRFTSDSVLLANFAEVKHSDIIADFGAGCGVISVLTAYKQKPQKVYAVELQPALADMAKRNARMNALDGVIETVNLDIKEFPRYLNGKKIDAVVCNPPYRKAGSGAAQEAESLRICRHEVKITLGEIVSAAAEVLKHKGRLYMVHQAQRAAEVFRAFFKSGIEPKIIRTVCSREGDAPNLVLVCGVKGANAGLKWLEPLVIFDAYGNYTKTVKVLYGDGQ